MSANTKDLLADLRNTLAEIEQQIIFVRQQAVEYDMNVHRMVDQFGNYVLSPLVVAKANVLCSIANLEGARGTLVFNNPSRQE